MTAFLRALRPHQWTKNLLVFAALLFSKHLFEPEPFFRASLAFVAFCGLAGAVYLWNDVADIERDRLHPRKKLRPLAAGELSIRAATLGALSLVVLALSLSFWLDARLGLCAASYLALNLAYSFGLKHVVILDVLCISLGFVLRALAGGYAIDVPVTEWLLVLALLLALFLALAKRRHEITSLSESATGHRAILAEYSPYLIDQMTSVVTASVVTAYAFYTLSPETVQKFGTAKLSWTLPLVLYGIFRYLYLVHQKERGDSPTDMLLTDRPLLATVALWVALVIAIVYTAQGVATPLGVPR
ncbi:MAG: decaprenyl-phosphate phosphoribosyltransferase [Vicinamibacteria bacterium]|jgi:4-hydroxybenzoate polyprenyltransferase|nr:decaprenyl-phosphate phosphoribosyltransferase [Vicinamibacteria bacterium]MBP9946556.1 decaprenyl-phosphate phosphoribosyltransferase [Vicinamibacteria bacterium]